jgi:hypothetical protein
MRIFVSSSFEDLKEHRAAAIRVLRQLGHEVLAMEDMIAGATAPLVKVLEMIDRSEAYVGIFAWRYGSVPLAAANPAPAGGLPVIPRVAGAVFGATSITHYEYLRAVERHLPVMAFLLDETCPWPPQFIDGVDRTRANSPENSDDIRRLRATLQQELVVSWFTTPADLEARVSAAVTMAGLTRQLNLQPAAALPAGTGAANDSIADVGIQQAILGAEDHQRALKIDLATSWWSTRLYLLASLSRRLTRVRRILVIDSRPEPSRQNFTAPTPAAVPPHGERLIGQLSVASIVATLGQKSQALRTFEKWLNDRGHEYSDAGAEVQALLTGWYAAFGDVPPSHTNEQQQKVELSPSLLRRWFGDSMIQQALSIADLERASAVDLLRLLDYPNDYVPVLTRGKPPTAGDPEQNRVDVVDKVALNARLARSYLVELLDRARLT